MKTQTPAQVLEALRDHLSRPSRLSNPPLGPPAEAQAITACLDALRKAREAIRDGIRRDRDCGNLTCGALICDALRALDAVLGSDDGR